MLGGLSRDAVDQGVLLTLRSIREGFHDVSVSSSGREIGSVTTPWGSTARLVIVESETLFTWSDTPIDVALDIDTPTAYVDGEVVGTITWSAGPKTARSDVRIEGRIDPPTAWWRLTHPFELGG